MDRRGQGRAGRDRGARGRILGRPRAVLPVSAAEATAGDVVSGINVWRRPPAGARPRISLIWYARAGWLRHLAVNRRGRSHSADSDAIRSNRVPKVKAARGAVAF